jgi:hypothetical protein
VGGVVAPRVPEGTFAAQISRSIVGVVLYELAGLLGWLVHPVLTILYFVIMLAYHAWTSQGIKKKRREE